MKVTGRAKGNGSGQLYMLARDARRAGQFALLGQVEATDDGAYATQARVVWEDWQPGLLPTHRRSELDSEPIN